MILSKQKFFIIDFDSTFIQDESMEVLAKVSLAKDPQKEKILEKINLITKQGMEGKIAFGVSLQKRLALIKLNENHLEQTVKLVKKRITPSFLQNKDFFKQFHKQVYIISGGFSHIVEPIVASFGIPKDHILSNTLLFDSEGVVSGIDKQNLLSQNNGKGKVVKQLQLQGQIYVIGDGYTDWEIKKVIPQVTFVAFTENVFRETVVKMADYVVPNFAEFLYHFRLPQSVSYPKSRMLTLLLENINQKAITAFEKQGFAVEYYERSLSQEELLQKIGDVSILGIRSRTKVSREILEHGKKLLTIGAFCIGTDQIDLAAAHGLGIAVFNAPYSNTRSVVELVVGEIIMLARGTFVKSNKLHGGVWDKSAKGSFEVRGKTIGIVGYGNIGSQLSVLAESLGMKVLFYDRSEKLALGNAIPCSTLKELLQRSDIVSIHVDGNKKNENLIGVKEFNWMRQGVILLNLSRGFVVDTQALVHYIKSGKIRGAGIDVFPYEPESGNEKFVSVLQGLENVLLTPHIGGSTIEAQMNIGEFVSGKIIDYINTGSTSLSVTMPQIDIPDVKHAHRLLHIHRNMPGILAKINGVLAKNDSNILGQELKTSEHIGYVVTDVNKKYNKAILKELKAIPETIKFRVLY